MTDRIFIELKQTVNKIEYLNIKINIMYCNKLNNTIEYQKTLNDIELLNRQLKKFKKDNHLL